MPLADLKMSLTHYPASVPVGGQLTLFGTAENLGPDRVDAGQVTFYLHPSYTYISSSSGCAPMGGNVSCPLGPLAAGATRTFWVRVSVSGLPGTVCTGAVVSGGPAMDPNASNNASQTCATVTETPNDEPPCVPACECADECCCDGGGDGGANGGGVETPPVRRAGGSAGVWAGGWDGGDGDGGRGCGCGECVDAGCSERPTASGAGAGAVDLNSRNFSFKMAILSIRGVGGSWGFGLKRRSGGPGEETSGPDVRGFENCQQRE